MAKYIQIILFVVIATLAASAGAAEDPFKGPWDTQATGGSGNREEDPEGSALSMALIRLFRKYVSPVDGSECPMYPTDSQYAVTAFEKHGFFIGLTMTWDRLYRCGRDEVRLSPRILVDDRWRTLDPVEDNDFWWRDDK